ncbi:MAG: DUF4431 domain-containing protein [Ktedonobacteraceae bacterium]|nr:DUF4431 domain-containing protein [Ktedonobacteraceae bacterium]
MQVRAAIAILLALFAPHAATACLLYWPAKVTVSGVLERITFPGRPNYESVRNGDEPEPGFYLKLSTPICTIGDKDSGTSYPVTDVSRIQLILDNPAYGKFRPFLGRHLTVQGTLMAAHTGHHHAPLLLDNVSVVSGNGR